MISPEERKEIDNYIDNTVWPHIKEHILKGDEDSASKEEAVSVLSDMEDIFRTHASTFGLTAMQIQKGEPSC
jgi:hypothetical protein